VERNSRALASAIEAGWQWDRPGDILGAHQGFMIDEAAERAFTEYEADGTEPCWIGDLTVAGTSWGYVLHEMGFDLFRLVMEDDGRDGWIERRFAGPLRRFEYREEMRTVVEDETDLLQARRPAVHIFIDAPLLDRPLTIDVRASAGDDALEEFKAARRVLRTWARLRPQHEPGAEQ
jgi:hypothetical protein